MYYRYCLVLRLLHIDFGVGRFYYSPYSIIIVTHFVGVHIILSPCKYQAKKVVVLPIAVTIVLILAMFLCFLMLIPLFVFTIILHTSVVLSNSVIYVRFKVLLIDIVIILLMRCL